MADDLLESFVNQQCGVHHNLSELMHFLPAPHLPDDVLGRDLDNSRDTHDTRQ